MKRGGGGAAGRRRAPPQASVSPRSGEERTPDGYHPDMTTVADALANDSAFEEHPFDPAAAAQYDTELD